jgi:serine/threonine protein kinase
VEKFNDIGPPFGIESYGYELLEKLGRGGFGTVFRAKQIRTGQIVAVKFLILDKTRETELNRKIERFERETRLCAELNHPNIVRLVDKCRTVDGMFFAVFEYVRGETLKEVLIREGILQAEKAGELMGQVLDGLSFAHERGVVHRDLKPANIMITTTGSRQHVKILDFGIGTFVPEVRKPDYMSLTLSKETVGTPSYCAPEQLRGEPPTVKSDVYAWGLVFLECLTGRSVMRGTTIAETFHRQLCPDDVPLPTHIIGHPLGDLLRRVLQKNHLERPGKTENLYIELKKINLTSIVGKLQRGPFDGSFPDMTETVSPWPTLRLERRQITVLSLSLGLTSSEQTLDPDFEVVDALQRELLIICADAGARFGGYLAGCLGDCTMLFFGYPNAGDNDARLAARTALELVGHLSRRSAILSLNQGIHMEFRIGIHTGIVTTCDGTPPSGMTANIAMKLHNMAPPGNILVSESTRRLLERHLDFEPFESDSYNP